MKIRDADISVDIEPGVLDIPQHLIDGLRQKLRAGSGLYSPAGEVLADHGSGLPAYIPLEDLSKILRSVRIGSVVPVFDQIPEAGIRIDHLPGQDTLPHSSADLLGKFRRIIFRKAFHEALQDDSLRAFRDVLHGVMHVHAVPLQPCLADGKLLAVPPEPVDLPDDHAVKCLLLRVPHEPLEGGPAFEVLAADMFVDISINDRDALLIGVGPAVPELSFDALIGLVGPGREPGVDDSVHNFLPKNQLLIMEGYGIIRE